MAGNVRRVFRVFMIVVLVLSLVPVAALSEILDSISLGNVIEQQVVAAETATNDDLYAGYIEQCFDAELSSKKDVPTLRARPSIGLSGNNSTIYWKLRTFVSEVASGKRTSTILEIPVTALTGGKTHWTAAELGVSSVVTNGSINATAEKIVTAKIAYDYNAVMDAILADCPYEAYWYDKGVGSSHLTSGYVEAIWVNDQYQLGFSDGTELVIKMPVSVNYSKSGKAGTYVAGTAAASRVTTALATAKKIVSDSASLSAYDRLMYFKNQILNLSDYNHTAAETASYPYGDPWQLISVFDGNPNTTVVCEGYSKAFQYLCDLANIPGVTCYSVSGTLSGGTNAGGHMWNLVKMDDGKVYLVDITNCLDWNAGYRYEPFLTPCTSGSVSGGYVVDNMVETLRYYYDSDTKSTYTTAELTLSKSAYSAPSEPVLINLSNAWISTISYQVYTGSAIKPSFYVILGSKVLVAGTDYTVSYKNNVNKGTATITITGKGSYTGTKSTTFKIVAPGWISYGGTYYYLKSDGTYLKNGWIKANGAYYYFGSDGKLVVSGWVYSGGKYYYMGSNGKMVVNGWVKYNGYYYYMDKNGNPVTGRIIYLDGHYYDFDAYGRLTRYTK